MLTFNLIELGKLHTFQKDAWPFEVSWGLNVDHKARDLAHLATCCIVGGMWNPGGNNFKLVTVNRETLSMAVV